MDYEQGDFSKLYSFIQQQGNSDCAFHLLECSIDDLANLIRADGYTESTQLQVDDAEAARTFEVQENEVALLSSSDSKWSHILFPDFCQKRGSHGDILRDLSSRLSCRTICIVSSDAESGFYATIQNNSETIKIQPAYYDWEEPESFPESLYRNAEGKEIPTPSGYPDLSEVKKLLEDDEDEELDDSSVLALDRIGVSMGIRMPIYFTSEFRQNGVEVNIEDTTGESLQVITLKKGA